MIPYILHVTVITTICFLFYKLLLQKETFYRLNRWTLMGCLAVSFSLPLLPVPQEWSWRDKWANSQETMSGVSREEKSVQPAAPLLVQPGVPAAGVEDPGVVRAGGQTGAGRVGEQTGVVRTGGQTGVKSAVVPGAGEQVGAVPRGEQNLAVTDRKASVAAAGGDRADVAGTGHGAGAKQSPGQQGRADIRFRNRVRNEAGTSETVLLDNTAASSIKPTTGTPVGKENAGTPVTIFSGSMVLLLVQWVFYIYLFGVVLFGANFLVQLGVLLYQSYARPVIQDGRFRIVEVSGNRAPCSFGNTIFINPEIYDWETYNQILIHEKIHVSGRHTLDILLAEIAVVVQWFNPFAWLYRREVENNLEFLTDADVLLHQEVERSAYQLSLLRVCAPHLPFSLTNNYNQSLLKRRIVMMNSKRSSLHTVWKYFFLIPILTGLVCTLNKPVLALGAGRTGSTTAHDHNTGSATPVNPLNLPLLFAAIADTAKHPAQPRKDSADDSYSTGTGNSEGSGYSDDDNVNDAYAQAAAASYIMAQQNYNLAVSVQAPLTISLQQAKVNVMARAEADNQAMITRIDQNNQLNTQVNTQVMTIQPQVQAINMAQDAYNINVNVGNLHISDSDLTDGSWFATTSGDHLSFELKVETEERSWSNTLHVDKNEINPFPGQGNVEFKLVREAGTMTFKGQFDGQEGFGHFHFTPDPAYYAALRQMGVEDMEDRRQFSFFSVNVKKDYVNMVMHSGYPHISQRDLISFAAMHIDQEFIQYWHGAGLTDADEPRSLISLKALKIDRAYVDDLKAAGYDHLDVRELQSLKAMKIDRAYVDDLKAAGYDHLEVRELQNLKAQHIDKAYIRSLGRGTDNEPIPVRELASYKALHIDSAYLDGLRKLGYTNLTTRDISSLYSMHVSPEYIKQVQELGYKDLSVRDLTNLRAMKITPEYIKGFRDIGYKDLDVRELDNLSAMKVTPEYVKSFQAIGYKDLNSRQLSNLKAMGITPEFVKAFADLGYTDLGVNKLSSLKAMNITPDFVKEFNKIGFDHIDVNLLTSLKATGVNAEYVSKMKERGFVSKDLNKYIRLKNDFN